MVKSLPPVRCHYCHRWVYEHRLTLPRAKTGELVFCNFQCQERWREDEQEDQLLSTIIED